MRLNKFPHLVLTAILVCTFFGCEKTGPVARPSDLSSLRINNEIAAPFDAIPDGFEKLNSTLFSKPITPVEQRTSATLFTSVDDSGINFTNTLSRTRSLLYIETGAGVALGDYDNDGLVDVYLTGTEIDNRLFRNLGDFKFEDVTEKAGVDGRIRANNVWASGASFADIDNDGDLDLYVCNMANANILYINQNDGTFLEQTIPRGADYSGASKQANFCDYDRDGDLDFYLVTYQDIFHPDRQYVDMVDGKPVVREGCEEYALVINNIASRAGEKDLLFQNQGDGTFKRANEEANINDAYHMNLGSVWFDFDDDGWQDIYVTSDFKNPDHFYRNNQDGTFTDTLADTVRHTPWFSMGLDAGDLNNDGRLDLIVGDMADRTHYGQKINMGNMADDGWFLTWGAPRQFMHNCVYLNSGTGKLMEQGVITGMSKTDWTWSIRMVDLDNDGNLDVHFTNGHARDTMNGDLLKEIGEKRAAKNLTNEDWMSFYESMNPRKGENLVFRNKGDLEFESKGPDWGLDHKGISHAIGFADLDNDGDLDAVMNNFYEPSTIYRNDSDDGSRIIVQMRSETTNRFGIGTKVEILQDGAYFRRDLSPNRGYQSSNPMSIHFGLPSDANIELLRITWPNGKCHEHKDIAVNHIYRAIDDNQGAVAVNPLIPKVKPQFADTTSELGIDFIYRENSFDDFEREPLLPYQLSKLGASLAWGDVNGDGFQDVFCSGASGQSGQLLLSKNGKSFEAADGPWLNHADREDMGLLFFDADQDGDQDLYVASGSNEFEVGSEKYGDRLYLNDGTGKFTVAEDALPKLTDSSSSVAAADFDRDGDLDLFVGSRSIPARYPIVPTSRLLLNNEGKFSEASAETSGDAGSKGLVSSALWSDYNNDGWVDLILALEWGPIAVFENQKGKLVDSTADAGIDQQLGWWHGIAGGDLDADGDMDYVVTNQGNNTKYHTSTDHPLRLYFDDFDGNGTLDLVEAEFEGDIEYPVRGRSCSSRCMPFIADKFETFHDFSVASLSDIYETDKKETPFHEVTVLESVVLRNQGDGTFTVEPLDRLAQGSPAYGVAIADFDGDSQLDVMLANNFFGSQPETGYMDGGLSLFMRGNAGSLNSVWPNKSGVSISCDSNGLGLADIDNDGDLDAMFAINNEPYRVYRNDSTAEKGLLIELAGPNGNGLAIGAQVRLIGEGLNRVAEVSAGGSYLSQSASQGIRVSAGELQNLKSIEVQWPDGSSSETDAANRKDGRILISAQP